MRTPRQANLATGAVREEEGEEEEQGALSPADRSARAYRARFSAAWWTRNRRYVLYMLREFSAVPVALWLLWFLLELDRARGGPAGYRPNGGPVFVAVSLVCLAFALWHSVTFLQLSGLIVRIPMGARTVPPRAIVVGSFLLLFLATAVVGGLLVLGGR